MEWTSSWLRHAYSWLHHRLDPQVRDTLATPIEPPVGPGPDLFPFLIASEDGTGDIGFVKIEYSSEPSTPGEKEIEIAVQGAASTVGDWFRQFDHLTMWPKVTVLASLEVDGASAGLSAFLLTLLRKLNIVPPEKCCATGVWNIVEYRFEPVAADTMYAKVAKAIEWGYKEVFVVEGQEGITEECGLTIHHVPPDATYASMEILKSISAKADAEQLARLLAIFDQRMVRTDPVRLDVQRVLRTTQVFIDGSWPDIVRHFAHDIRSRTLLHVGQTTKANEERARADTCEPKILPDGWLGDYLAWHRAAHHSVIALDQGRWSDEDPDNLCVDERIRQIEACPKRYGTLLACMYLCNTRGRRREYLGRIHENTKLLRSSWEDRIKLLPYWNQLFEYARRLGLSDGGMRFQHNQCMDVIASHWLIAGRLPEGWDLEQVLLWPDSCSAPSKKWTAFDLSAYVRWKRITGMDLSNAVLEKIFAIASEFFERANGSYPSYTLFETLLIYGIGTKDMRKRSAKMLMKSILFNRDLSSHSILSLLAIRAEHLVERYVDSVREPVRPTTGSQLAMLGQQLRTNPDRIVARCPY